MLSLLVESWIWYAFGCVILVCRYISRWLQLGSIKRYEAGDYIMIFVFGFYTTLVVTINIMVHYPTNVLQPEDIPKLTPETIAARVYGSKLVVVVEQTMIMTLWGCKISVLYFYNKLTFGLTQQHFVGIVAIYVCLSWLVMEVLYFLVWCRPFPEYYAVPTDNIQCTQAMHHLITEFVCNVSTDLFILCIPLPVFITSKLPLAKKLMVCALFSLGIFVILCAVLNKYNSFRYYSSPLWTYWYIRETSTAVYIANMPMCWGLIRRLFSLRSFNSERSYGHNKAIKAGSNDVPTIGGSSFGSSSGAPLRSINSKDGLMDFDLGKS